MSLRWLLWVVVLSLQGANTVSFSHQRHAPLKFECSRCHVTAKTGEQAGYPAASICLTCHGDMRPLAALPKTEPIEPKLSVYMLAEFAYFSHARHSAAKIACLKCHGDVWQMAQVRQVLPMTMKACVTCHRASGATTKCGKCHELGQ